MQSDNPNWFDTVPWPSIAGLQFETKQLFENHFVGELENNYVQKMIFIAYIKRS